MRHGTLKETIVNSRKITIIGGGIVGLATAYRLTERFPGARVAVLEKETGVGRHQTGHNSGVLHCGLYYKPGSVKARLAVSGIRQMVAFCQENGDSARDLRQAGGGRRRIRSAPPARPREARHGERPRRAAWSGREEMREIEPHVGGVAALRVPQEGIVDYPKVCATLVAKLRGAAREVVTGARVDRLRPPAPAGSRKHPAGVSRRTSSSTAPGCIATASRNWRESGARCGSCRFAASITRSGRTGSTWCAT